MMKSQHNQRPKVIAIAGPTASGKSNFAIGKALEINGEIISADSRLVYKGFNIACAKPSIEERQGVLHHLIDIVEPEIDYSVANFYDDARKAIFDILNKNKTPIIVGGTGLYFRILLEDFNLPRVAPNWELRNELEQKTTEELYEELAKLDFQSAEKIHKNNKVRLIRTLEIAKTLDAKPSELIKKKELEFDVEWIGLSFSREELYSRINKRVDLMVKNGLIEETKDLLKKHGKIKNFVKTIGYQEILEYLDGNTSLETAIELIKQNTRHYAKRQLTWFRRNKALKIE